jgi:hypothetical protein
MKIRFLLSCVVLGFLLAGCRPFVDRGQPRVDFTDTPLSPGQTVGQSFTSRQPGLSSLEVFLAPDQSGQGEIILHLRNSPQSGTDLASGSLPAGAVTQAGFYRFYFQPQADSFNKDYYLLIELKGEGKLKAGSAGGSAYLDGSLYSNGKPVDAQLAFRPVYGVRLLAIGLLKQALSWLWLLGLAVLVFIVPGWAILSGLWAGWAGLTWGEKSGLAGGVSLALYPVLFLWTDLARLHLGAGYAWLPMLAGLAFLIWHNRAWVRNIRGKMGRTFRLLPSQGFNLETALLNLALCITVVLVIVLRLWAARLIDIPMWGDSYQHTMIAQLFVDNRGLFASWLPYVPYDSLSVQYGFSANAAIYSWLSRLDTPQSALLTAQFINIIAILALYPLAVRLSRGNRWAGVAALVAGGLLAPMPLFYVNWGRFAQLAGQAILPVGIWLLWDTLDKPDWFDWKKIGLIGLTLAGMLLAYYRMAFYFSTFFIAWLIGWGLPKWGFKWTGWRQPLLKFVEAAGFSALFVSPWVLRVSGSSLASSVESGASKSAPLAGVIQDYRAWQGLTTYLPAYLVILALIAMVWGLFRKDWMVSATAIWVITLSGVKAASLIKLPGANMMQSFAVLIALYIPASLLVGWLFVQIMDLFPIAGKKSSIIMQSAAALLLVAVGIYGALQQKDVADPGTYALVNRPDLRAMHWIQANTPQTARFLVESYSIYDGASVVGSDAGWWISLLARRQNTVPPQYALLNEKPDPKDYSQRVVALVNLLEKQPVTQSGSIAQLCQEGVSYIYIGQGQGEIGSGAHQLYSPQDLLASSAFRLEYRQDRVWIFSLNPKACRK